MALVSENACAYSPYLQSCEAVLNGVLKKGLKVGVQQYIALAQEVLAASAQMSTPEV